ncbi:3-isopropylmalate dehydrogenase [Entomobacter blattae]|uniref:3-isopropylmalate dehydrogenase n=1 Tax=Entomobacter blattae TaxID=2762277 RepID=A0A7H1NNT5_9PROT|nr:3-isopropylmalate dehydrogenase [Entomobacter blattae]QNT77445.1 3-isopropylmalate dehydrogenase [Entomobacter blattae]
MKANIVTLPGDGIGPEIVTSAVNILKEIAKIYNHDFSFEEHLIGGAAIDATGNPLPKQTLLACQKADAVLLGAVGGPKWAHLSNVRPEQGLLALRKALNLFANIRPIHTYDALLSLSSLKEEKIKGVDFIFVRELTGGAYFGKKTRTEKTATDETLYTVEEIERVSRKAFELAHTRRKHLTSVDKANVLETSRLWRETISQVAQDYPDVKLEHQLVDSMAMMLLINPAHYDVIVTENLFGDILTDECAALSGSLGLLPSASLGKESIGLYEPIHGSAPDIAGKNIANPIGTILSVSLLLQYSLGLVNEAIQIEKAVNLLTQHGPLTADLGGNAYTTEITKAVINNLHR